jgi:hypothetical protein
VTLTRHRNDVPQFIQGHNCANSLTKSGLNAKRDICANGRLGYYNLKYGLETLLGSTQR